MTPTGTVITDITNLGAGDQICRDFTGGTSYSGPSVCTVNGVASTCTNPTGGRICIAAASLTTNLFNPTLANCSALTSAASRLRNVQITCGTATTGLVPSAYAMPVTDGTIGGPGDGYANGSIQVCAIDRWTGAATGQAVGVQVESAATPPVILARATIPAGSSCVTITAATLTGPLTVTGATEGYQIFTVTKADARQFELPMTKRASREQAESTAANTWFLEGDFLIASFDAVHAATNRHNGCKTNLAPNPIRGGLAITALYRTSFTGLSLDALLGASVQKNLAICTAGGGGLNLNTPLPGNLATPDIMGGTDVNHFEGLRTSRATNVMIQALGASLSPEALQITALLNGADFDITGFDLLAGGQEMAILDPSTYCPGNNPGGRRCNTNAAAGGSYDIADMPDYTHAFPAVSATTGPQQYWAWNWTAANGTDVNVQSQFEQNTTAHAGYDPDTFYATNLADVVAEDPKDTDFVRFGVTAYFGCGNDPTNGNPVASCYNSSGLSRAARGFIGRDFDRRYGLLKGENLSVYGLFIDSGTLVDTLVALNLSLQPRVEGPNTAGGSAVTTSALGGPLQASAVTYINGKRAGAVTTARAGTIGTWFKFEARGAVHLNIASAVGGGTCTTAIAPRAGTCIVSGWDDDNTIGIPVPVQDGVGLSPYDMGDGADVTQCVASVAPGEACLAMTGGDVRTLGLGSRTFVFDNNSPALVAPWGDPDIIVHTLSVNGGQAFYAGALATTPIYQCQSGTNNGQSCSVDADCPGGTAGLLCNQIAKAVGSNDDAWMIGGAGPGMYAGAQQSFVLPDLRAACPSCVPSTTLSVKDWRHLDNGATPAPAVNGGPGVSQLDLDNCIAPGCKTAARGICVAGAGVMGAACTADATCDGATAGSGVCGQKYTAMDWSMFGYGSATLNSCTTANAWHYREINAAGLGGLEECRNFAVNKASSIFNY